MYECVNGMIEN